MIVSKSYYDYYTTVDGYFVEGTLAVPAAHTYSITLYKVTDDYQEELYTDTFILADVTALVFDGESEYFLEISDDDGFGTVVTDGYNIKYFPTLKSDILTLMKSAICAYCGIDSGCCTSESVMGVNTLLNTSQLASTSSDLYEKMLFSTSFSLSPLTETADFYNTNADLLLAKTLLLFEKLSDTGNIPYSNFEFATNMGLLYLILYNAELTYIGYGYSGVSNDITDAQIAALKTTFAITDIAACYTNLNISLTGLMYADYGNAGTVVAVSYYIMPSVALINGYNTITHGQGSIAQSLSISMTGYTVVMAWGAESGMGYDETNELSIYNSGGNKTVKLTIGF